MRHFLNHQLFPITWIKNKLEAAASKFLKRWAGSAKSTNLICHPEMEALTYLSVHESPCRCPVTASC